jgi:RHS repeat-associated protein
LQTVDYSYNIRKWLTAINNPNNLGNDLFGMSIGYTGIYQLGDTPNYNGNIGGILWKHKNGVEKQYAYYYDNLNRLTSANYKEENPIVTSVLPTTDQYNTTYSYDRNGNIKTLTRNGFRTDGTFGQIDNLDYRYSASGALDTLIENGDKERGLKSKIIDGLGRYTFDANGNMITDTHKGMTVEYNHLNLPIKVIKPEGIIEWIYDAAGTKLSKTVTTNHLEVNDNPMLSKEYKASMTIESQGTVPNVGGVTFTAGQSITLKEGFTANAGSDFLARILPNNVVQVRDYCDGLEYFESSLEAIYYADGRVKYNGNNIERQYILADYQGNNRVLFKDNGSGVAEQIEGYSYYPFGAIHGQKRDYLNNYLNEGKELQTELGLEWSDYHLRYKDNWMGRFMGIDVLADSYSSTSPYSYGLGNPVSNGDPTGASVQKFTGEEAQQVFKGVQNSYNDAVSSGQNVNFKSSEIGGLVRASSSNSNSFHPGTNDAARIDDVINSFKEAGVENIGDAVEYYDNKGPSVMFSDPENGQPWQYVYTEGYGWIDLAHFFKSASTGMISVPLGEAIEVAQKYLREDSPSAYSYEDLPSNLQGAIFLKQNGLVEGKAFYTALKNHFTAIFETDFRRAPNWSSMPKISDSSPNQPKNKSYRPLFAPRFNEVDAKYKPPFKYFDKNWGSGN